MLEYEHATIIEQIAFHHEMWYFLETVKCVGRIGKDEIKLQLASLDEAESVEPQRLTYVRAKIFETVNNESMMLAVLFNTHHPLAAARHQFERYAASARKEIQSRGSIQFDVRRQNIENVFFGEIRSRPRLERAWYLEMPTSVFPSYYSHYYSFFNISIPALSP